MNPSPCRLARPLYRSLIRIAQEYRAAGVPLVGINARLLPNLSHGQYCTSGLNGPQGLKTIFLASRTRSEEETAFDDGFMALRALRQQLRVLSQADADARKGLKYWELLLRTSRQHLLTVPSDSQKSSHVFAASLEDAAIQLSQLTSVHGTSSLMADEGCEQDDAESITQKINSLADEVRKSYPALFNDSFVTSNHPHTITQVEALVELLFGRLKFKSLPVEWVYDGLHPLLLADVIERRNGISITLAILSQAISRRLGIECILCQATAFSTTSSVKGARSATHVPPQPGVWLLCFPSIKGQDGMPVIVDPARKGHIMTWSQCMRAYPEAVLSKTFELEDLVHALAALVRCVVVAHQRRGESEAVASWLYQLLALDMQAPEWEFMLSPSPLNNNLP